MTTDLILTKLEDQPYLTDSGLETTLVFHDGLDLPYFAAFTLLESGEGRKRLRQYYQTHLQLARNKKSGFILEAPTWRANKDWAERMDMSLAHLDSLNRLAISELKAIQAETNDVPTLVSGCIGPRGDGYQPDHLMTSIEAYQYHCHQIEVFASCGVDMVSAMTICYVEEAIGITRAAQNCSLPIVISFTVETDGRLVTGMDLKTAIELVDRETNNGPAWYMINCAHPSHFDSVLNDESWLERIRGIRANASTLSHAELDNAEELDDGNPTALGASYHQLQKTLPKLAVFGGCCGTDHRHIEAISNACL